MVMVTVHRSSLGMVVMLSPFCFLHVHVGGIMGMY